MKKIFFLIACFVALSAKSQSADEVVQKYSANLGGLDAFNKISTAKFTGVVLVQGMELPVTSQVINGKSMRVDVDAMGQSVINVYHNGTGWKLNPFAGVSDATDVTGSELAELKSQTYLASALMDYKNRGYTVVLDGQGDVEGKKAYKLILDNTDEGKKTTYYISTDDYMLLKSVSTRDIQGQEVEMETYYSDYKTFGDIKFSMTKRQEVDGQEIQSISFSNVELNVPVDEKIFSK